VDDGQGGRELSRDEAVIAHDFLTCDMTHTKSDKQLGSVVLRVRCMPPRILPEPANIEHEQVLSDGRTGEYERGVGYISTGTYYRGHWVRREGRIVWDSNRG
jgi:hypothetical protein